MTAAIDDITHRSPHSATDEAEVGGLMVGRKLPWYRLVSGNLTAFSSRVLISVRKKGKVIDSSTENGKPLKI